MKASCRAWKSLLVVVTSGFWSGLVLGGGRSAQSHTPKWSRVDPTVIISALRDHSKHPKIVCFEDDRNELQKGQSTLLRRKEILPSRHLGKFCWCRFRVAKSRSTSFAATQCRFGVDFSTHQKPQRRFQRPTNNRTMGRKWRTHASCSRLTSDEAVQVEQQPQRHVLVAGVVAKGAVRLWP
jgi:hypothetical protein